jgi:sugar lactone lactonase YvrE
MPTLSIRLVRSAAALLLSTAALLAARAGAQSVLFNGVVTPVGAGFGGPEGVARDASGDLFVADCSSNVVKEIVAVNGSISATSQIKLLGGSNGFPTCPNGVVLDASGNLFVSASGSAQVIEIPAAGGYSTYSYVNNTQLANASNVYDEPVAIAIDGSGNLWLAHYYNKMVEEVEAVNGSIPANPVIRSWGPNFTVVGDYAFGFLNGIAVDPSGDVFVVDGTGVITEMEAVSGVIPAAPTTKRIQGTIAQASTLATDAAGNLYTISNGGYGLLTELTAASGYATAVVLAEGYETPTGLTTDSHGNFFISQWDTLSAYSVVSQLNLASANFGAVAMGSTSAAIPITFYFPDVVTLGSKVVLTRGSTGGDFADAGTGTCPSTTTYYYNGTNGYTCTVNVVLKPTSTGLKMGSVQLRDGSGNVLASAYVQGTGTGPQVAFGPTQSSVGGFTAPGAIAVDGAGDLFVLDNGVLKEATAASGYSSITTLSSLTNLSSLAMDGAGNIFVTATSTNAVEELLAAGGYANSQTIGSGFSSPFGLAVDGSGNVFVADEGNNAVKEVLAGTGYKAVITVGSGIGVPAAVAVDGSGNVFVADNLHSAIKEIVAVNGVVSAASQTNTLVSGVAGPNSVLVDGGALYYTNIQSNTVSQYVLGLGATSRTFGTGLGGPLGLAADAAGNIYLANLNTSAVYKLNFSTPPSLTFDATKTGSTSADSPQTVQLYNNGTTTLDFSIPTTGSNPSLSSNFSLGLALCPVLYPTNFAVGTLTAGAGCYVPVSFTPTTTGAISGQMVFTDNSGGVTGATQTVNLAGTGLSVAPTATSTLLTSSLNPSGSGQTVVFTAVVTPASGAVVPTGTVQFTINSAPAGPAMSLSASGTAFYSTAALTLKGSANTVVATYTPSAGSTFSGSVSPVLVQTVSSAIMPLGTTAITFSVPNHTFGDAAFPVAASSSSTGAFTYSVLTGPASVSGSTVTLSGAGSVVMQATQAATSTYASASQTAAFLVAQATPTLTLSSSAQTLLYDTSVTFTAKVSSPAGTPTGTVSFYQGTAMLGSASLSSGVASLPTTGLIAGTDSVTAVYSGDANFVSVTSSAVSETVQSFALSTPTGSATSQTVGASGGTATYTLAATPEGTSTFQAPVAFAVTGLPTGATATFTPSSLAAGAAATNVTLTIQVPATAWLTRPELFDRRNGVSLAALALGLLLPFTRRRLRARLGLERLGLVRLVLVLCGGLLAAAGLTGCTPTPTPTPVQPQTYTITVTGTSGAFSSSTSLTLTVN